MADASPTAETFAERIAQLKDDLRAAIRDAEDAREQALYETAAETLDGLHEAFADFNEGEEEAWQE